MEPTSSGERAPKVRCLFCQQPDAKLSVEHILSDPIRKHVDSPGPFTANIFDRPMDAPERKLRASWESDTLSGERRAVCTTCNSGWMHDLDHEVSSLIGPMIRGVAVTLSKREQQRIAAWAVKVALVCASALPKSCDWRVTQEECFRFFAEQRPIAGEPIELAWYVVGQPQHAYAVRPFAAVSGGDIVGVQGVLVSILIGQLMVQCGLPGTHPVLSPDADSGPHFVRIWPVTGKVSWPPSQPITDYSTFRMLTSDY